MSAPLHRSSTPAQEDDGGGSGKVSLPPIYFVNSSLAPVPCPGAKLLALYFSAHWCGPCRGFTPKLQAFYNQTSREDIDIIFISLDRNAEAFADYYAGMPWLAADYDKTERDTLYDTLHIRGIPALVVFCPRTGRIISADGRSDIIQNETNPQACLRAWLQA